MKTYQVWALNAPYSDNPQGWSVQHFTDVKDAYECAGATVADEITIEVWQDKGWVNDHVKQQKLLSFNFA